MVALSLGYRAALADLLLAKVMVAAGTHLLEKRLFEFAPDYLDTINALDPKLRDAIRDALALTRSAPRLIVMSLGARRGFERAVKRVDVVLYEAAGRS